MGEREDRLTDRYDREARAYRDLWAPVLQKAGRRLVSRLSGIRAERILDVGTGVGSLLPDLVRTFPGALVLGVDRSRGMLALAPRRTNRAIMDAAHLAVLSESVDVVLMVFMLFHLERPVEGLREARRVLRRGGRVGTLTWGDELQSTATRVWTDCLDAHGAGPPDPATQARHEEVDEPEKMEALLRGAGFGRARSWSDELIHSIDLDRFIRLRTSMGSAKPRFDSLTPGAQAACVAGARRRMQGLTREHFVARGRVVCAVADA